ncbi:MAG: hypothetical protein H7A48_14485 [Akkermansiaceae bacterium]|nr:hypothetical protein [Akkermansiaceae bacterium]MCP5549227.1 hypothetical protein [Akkermansiaceae bacterium]
MDLRDIFSGAMTRARWAALGAYLSGAEIQTGPGLLSRRVGNKTIIRLKKNRFSGGGSTLPFEVTLIKEGTAEAPEYKVTVAKGYVCERKPGAGDSLAYHEPANIMDEEDATKPAKFAIAAGEAVYVSTSVKEDGTIGSGEPGPGEEASDAVTIVVEADEAESEHYQPKVDDESSDGVAGTMKYKLAVLEEGEGEESAPKLKRYLAGSHIAHFQELPSILSTNDPGDGIGVIPKKWDNDARAYKLRSVNKGLGENNVTTNDDHVEVRGTKKALNVLVQYGNIEVTTPDVEFKDGYCKTGTDIIGDEPSPPEPTELKILIPTVEVESQFSVSFANNVFTVGGNDKDGTLTVTVEGESPQTALEWEDGQVTSEGSINIAIPSSDVSGYTGDLIVNDCDPDTGTSPDWGMQLIRLRIENGVIKGVNELEDVVVPEGDIKRVLVQSCHWIDDPDL